MERTEYNNKYYQKNKDYFREYNCKYREEHKDYYKNYYKENKDRFKDYYEENKENIKRKYEQQKSQYVYRIFNDRNKIIYVGSCVHKARMKAHLSFNTHLKEELKNFTDIKLEYVELKDLNELERRYIEDYFIKLYKPCLNNEQGMRRNEYDLDTEKLDKLIENINFKILN